MDVMRSGIPTAPQLDAAIRDVPGARESLIDAVIPTILQWCNRLGGPRVDAEDACHDACLVVLSRLHTVNDPDRFASWLFGICRRVLAQHRRKAWWRRWVPGAVPDGVDGGTNPYQAAEISEIGRHVRQILEAMSVRDREILVLFDAEGRTEGEVAELLDLPIGTVRSRVRNARERFRSRYALLNISANIIVLEREKRS